MPGMRPVLGSETQPVQSAWLVDLSERLPHAHGIGRQGCGPFLFCVTGFRALALLPPLTL